MAHFSKTCILKRVSHLSTTLRNHLFRDVDSPAANEVDRLFSQAVAFASSSSRVFGKQTWHSIIISAGDLDAHLNDPHCDAYIREAAAKLKDVEKAEQQIKSRVLNLRSPELTQLAAIAGLCDQMDREVTTSPATFRAEFYQQKATAAAAAFDKEIQAIVRAVIDGGLDQCVAEAAAAFAAADGALAKMEVVGRRSEARKEYYSRVAEIINMLGCSLAVEEKLEVRVTFGI